jgi:homoserine kinase type II
MTHVYLLWHVRSDDDHGDDAKLVGVYSSDASAQAAIERKKAFPGFADYPDGFEIARYEIDRDAWSEGFVSA